MFGSAPDAFRPLTGTGPDRPDAPLSVMAILYTESGDRMNWRYFFLCFPEIALPTVAPADGRTRAEIAVLPSLPGGVRTRHKGAVVLAAQSTRLWARISASSRPSAAG